MEPFRYSASDHAQPAQAAPAPQKPDEAPAPSPNVATAPPSGPQPFAYPETDKAEPKGAENVPENIRALRENDDARRMFSPQKTYAEALPISDGLPEDHKAAVAEFREILADAEVSVNDARELVGIARELTELPSPETQAAWEAEAHQALREQYGEKGAQAALADARALVARDPRLAHFLRETGLGSNPKYVVHAARLVRQQRARGRLK